MSQRLPSIPIMVFLALSLTHTQCVSEEDSIFDSARFNEYHTPPGDAVRLWAEQACTSGDILKHWLFNNSGLILAGDPGPPSLLRLQISPSPLAIFEMGQTAELGADRKINLLPCQRVGVLRISALFKASKEDEENEKEELDEGCMEMGDHTVWYSKTSTPRPRDGCFEVMRAIAREYFLNYGYPISNDDGVTIEMTYYMYGKQKGTSSYQYFEVLNGFQDSAPYYYTHLMNNQISKNGNETDCEATKRYHESSPLYELFKLLRDLGSEALRIACG